MKPWYVAGNILIYCGKAEEVVPHIGFHRVVTDPPYGIDLSYGTGVVDSFDQWKLNMQWLRRIFESNTLKSMTVSTSKIEAEAWLWQNFPPRWRICWYKGATSTRSTIGFKDWEPIFVWGRPYKQVHDWFRASPERDYREEHPCPKPLEWALWLMERFPEDSDITLDPFMGTGTTLVAAKKLGKPCIGIEVNEKYCELAVRRLNG